MHRSECVIPTLEGIGITESKCPSCGQPGWKNDLRPHLLHQGIVDFVRQLRVVSPSGLRRFLFCGSFWSADLNTKRNRLPI